MTKYSLRQFSDKLKQVAKDTRQTYLKRAALSGAYVIEGNAKINIRNKFDWKTGGLAGSVTTDVTTKNNKVIARTGPTVVYGRIQELGGTIRPVHAKRLHWVDDQGQHHSALQVTLPARPYLAPALEEHTTEVLGAISESLRLDIEGDI